MVSLWTHLKLRHLFKQQNMKHLLFGQPNHAFFDWSSCPIKNMSPMAIRQWYKASPVNMHTSSIVFIMHHLHHAWNACIVASHVHAIHALGIVCNMQHTIMLIYLIHFIGWDSTIYSSPFTIPWFPGSGVVSPLRRVFWIWPFGASNW